MTPARWGLEHEPYEPLPAARNRPGEGRTHGTISSYRAGCHDECCRRAARLAQRAARARKARVA